MQISKKLNNNVVIAKDEMNNEYVLIGRGLAFGMRIGQFIDPNTAEQVFYTKEKGVADKLSKIVQEIPLEHVRICDEIINMAKKQLQEDLNEKIYLTLIDHISFAIERHNAGTDINSLLKCEIKKIAPREYQVGLDALKIIKIRLEIELPADEAVFIAFHIINSRSKSDPLTEKSINLTRQILEIIQKNFTIDSSEDSVSYNRFIVHLQYLARRVFKQDETIRDEKPSALFNSLRKDIPECDSTVNEISQMIELTFGYQLSDNEKSYLMIHLYNVLSR
jgi:beta-glucoside operon transcriptional antiterminator